MYSRWIEQSQDEKKEEEQEKEEKWRERGRETKTQKIRSGQRMVTIGFPQRLPEVTASFPAPALGKISSLIPQLPVRNISLQQSQQINIKSPLPFGN